MKTYLYRTSNLKSTITFLPLSHCGSQFLAPVKKRCFLRFIHQLITIIFIIIIIIKFFIRVFSEYTEALTTSLIPIDAILPEICTLLLVLAVLRD